MPSPVLTRGLLNAALEAAPAEAWRDESTGEVFPDLAAALVDVAARLRALAPNETAVIRLCITRVPAPCAAREARAR